MGRVLRRIGIAIGSLVAAALAVSLIAGPFLGSNANGNAIVRLVTVVIGGLIYQDIIRREQRSV